MNRRSFIVASILSLLGISTFSLVRWTRHSREDKALAEPKFLSLLCDKSTIRMLGRAYLQLKPDETKDNILLNDLLAEETHKVFLNQEDVAMVESHIEDRIVQDFGTDNIVMVQGWVLSVTEARQCALFSIVNE